MRRTGGKPDVNNEQTSRPGDWFGSRLVYWDHIWSYGENIGDEPDMMCVYKGGDSSSRWRGGGG